MRIKKSINAESQRGETDGKVGANPSIPNPPLQPTIIYVGAVGNTHEITIADIEKERQKPEFFDCKIDRQSDRVIIFYQRHYL